MTGRSGKILIILASHDPKRLLHFPNLLNARDLGGYHGTVDGTAHALGAAGARE